MTRARDVANLIGSGNFSSTTFTATAGQTAFTISHTQGFVQVFMNGLLLDETVDYTSNGSAITLTSGAAAGDEIEVVKYNTFSVGDAIPASGGTFTGNVTHSGTVTNNSDVAINGTLTTTSTGTVLSSNSYNVVTIQTDKDDNGSNDDGILKFTTGSSNTVKGELRYDESENMFEIGHGDNQGHVRIDSSGRVMMPNQPSFAAYRDAGDVDAGNVYIFDHTHHNIGGMYDTSTGRGTVPVTGNYHVSFWMMSRNDQTYNNKYVRLRINSASPAYKNVYTSNGGSVHHQISWAGVIRLQANDYVDIYVNDYALYGANYLYSNFSMHLLS